MRALVRPTLFTACLLACGCSGIAETTASPQPCTEGWFQLVEQRYGTSDGLGHGPDVGSLEWRSTIEFKIGIRGDPDVPAVDDERWCRYIDTHYIRPVT
jgi:hypothetical protein